MLHQFINEIIDAILHFCKYFHLSQNVSDADLFKQMSAAKYTMDPRDIFLCADGFTGEAVVQCDVQVIENTFGGR